MDINKLSIEEKIGQKFMFGVNSSNVDIIIDLIKNYYIGGVILYKKNYSDYNEMLSVIKKLKDANKGNKIPLFIAIDQEGGRVNRMPSEFKNLKNIYDISNENESLITRYANVTGKMLKQSGINMNFAPVMDLYENDSKILYKRCFSGTVDDVYRLGLKYVKDLSCIGVIPVIKHFPGHGISKFDSHFITPYIYNYKEVLEKHILPFDKAITNTDELSRIDVVMVGHLVIRGMTGGMPASISKSFIYEYLRKRNNFNGVVITDEINMLSRNPFYKFTYMKRAFLSGSDIILVKIKNNGSNIIDKCIKTFNNNEEYSKLLDESVDRIIKLKEKYNLCDDISYDGCNIEEINKEICKINNLCS